MLVVLSVAVVALLAPPRASAQDPGSLFDQGLEHMLAGRYKVGCAMIEQSKELDPRPGTIFTLAECYAKGGKPASAVEQYDRYLELFGMMAPEDQQRQKARSGISRRERTRLLEEVPWLTVLLSPELPSDAVITLDGEPFDRRFVGVATAQDPGPHIFTLRTPGGPIVEQRVDLTLGRRQEVTLALPSGSPATDPPPTSAQQGEASGPTSSWVYVFGGVGVAALITGGVSGTLLLGKRSIIRSDCFPQDRDPITGEIPCTRKGKDAADSALNVLGPVTTVAFATAGVSLAAAALIAVLDGGATPERSSDRGPTVQPALSIGPRAATLSVTGGW